MQWANAIGHVAKAIPQELTRGIFIRVTSRRPTLWSSGQNSWLLTQRSRVRFLRYRIESGTDSTQPREHK
jgi:hypothetical protein